MRIRVVRGAASLALVVGGAVAVPAALASNPVAPVDGGTAVQQCYAHGSSSVDDPGYDFCRSLQQVVDDAAAACRMPLRSTPDTSAPEYCGLFDGREVSEAKVRAYERSWVHSALSMQRDLDASAPLWEEQIPHTHNSFNASSYYLPTNGSAPSYYPTLTNQDPNQVYSMTDQLRMDIRALEIDLHWVPSPYGTPQTHGYWVTMCHGDGEATAPGGPYVHVGCTDDRPLQDGLIELRNWLATHRDQFVMIYLENQLYTGGPVASDSQASSLAATLIRQTIGRYVYQPPQGRASGHCTDAPYAVSAHHVLASGKQVLLVGNCGPGSWNNWVFTRGAAWDESGNPTHYSNGDCLSDREGMSTHSVFRRWYEESPWLEAMTGATQVLTASTTARMVSCGVNIIGFDQLQPFDGRLAALVWSWAQGEPAASSGACAYQGGDTRFHASDCGVARHFACVDAGEQWHVTAASGPWVDGFNACADEFPGSSFGVPPNGWRNVQLATAKGSAGDTVWLDYARDRAQRWTPGISAGDATGDVQPPDGDGGGGGGGGPCHSHGRGHNHHRCT